MTLDEFIVIVKRMRDSQKDYFQTRGKDHLARSKTFEGQVDRAIKAHVESKQKKLFDE